MRPPWITSWQDELHTMLNSGARLTCQLHRVQNVLRAKLVNHKHIIRHSSRGYRYMQTNQSGGHEVENFQCRSKLQRTAIAFERPQHGHTFKVLTWNILADGLAQNGDFIKVDPAVLTWQHRLPLIVEELKESQADIICLQELNHFDELKTHLATLGYEGNFLAKGCSPAARYQCPPDGLAIFYRTARFVASRAAHGRCFMNGSGEQQSQVFLHIHLQDTSADNAELVVVTTHLKAKEGADMDEVRLKQVRQLLAGIQPELGHQQAAAAGSGSKCGLCLHHSEGATSNMEDPSHSDGRDVPVILVGDFNATPSSRCCQELRAAGFLSIWDMAAMSSHGEHMGSSTSFSGSNAANLGQEFSTWKFRSKGESKRIIDHVWWTGSRVVRPISRWRMLSEQEIGPNALPCSTYASDHIALCCEFEWAPQ